MSVFTPKLDSTRTYSLTRFLQSNIHWMIFRGLFWVVAPTRAHVRTPCGFQALISLTYNKGIETEGWSTVCTNLHVPSVFTTNTREARMTSTDSACVLRNGDKRNGPTVRNGKFQHVASTELDEIRQNVCDILKLSNSDTWFCPGTVTRLTI